MTANMSPELYWLTLTVLMTALFWVPYILRQLAVMGPWNALLQYSPDMLPAKGWPHRAYRAHMNAVENLVLFAPLAVGVHMLGLSGPLTAAACMVYFLARAVHYVVYVLGIPVVRTLAFAVGFGAQLVLAFVILGLM